VNRLAETYSLPRCRLAVSSRLVAGAKSVGEVDMADLHGLYWKGELIGWFEPEFYDFPRCLGKWNSNDTAAAENFVRAIRADDPGRLKKSPLFDLMVRLPMVAS
jgi:hypothetical protein